MTVLILAGGLGTRLRKIVSNRPKPMILIANRPFLEYLILQLKRYSLTDIVLCIGHLGEQIREYFGDGGRWGVQITYSYEKRPLGTGGAIKLAERLIKEDDFLVMNADSFLDVDPNRLIEYHLTREALVTMALVEVEDPGRYGAVEANENGEIKSFVEKGQGESTRPGLINGGIYVLNREIFKYIPEGRVSLEKEVFPKLTGKRFYGMLVKGFFIDIGVPEDYKKLQENPGVLLQLLEISGRS